MPDGTPTQRLLTSTAQKESSRRILPTAALSIARRCRLRSVGFLHLAGLFGGLFDAAYVHERRLRQVVPLAVAKFFEAADRVGDLRELARLAGEGLGHEERLRKEPFDAAGATHDVLVVFGEFVDTENRDDVLQFAIPLEDLLHAAGDSVVPFADDLRIE